MISNTGERRQPHTLPKAGTRIGQYELIRELGRGGMGAVYLARDTKLGRRVAVKFLQSDQPEITARFILEARATARCNHENIVVIHEVSEHQGNPFMVLEYLQGTSLGELLEGGRTLSPSRAIELMVPVVRALVCAHERNIVHRDLKPDNIFVTETGTVKVLDFGIAKLAQQQQSSEAARARDPRLVPDGFERPELTQRGALVGTLPYMSPEQWGAGEVDHRTDIWAVGIILFKMLAGKHPLAPLQGRQLMITGLLDEPMPSIREACPDLSEELLAVVDRCLLKRKEQRIGSARELLDVLEPLLPGRQVRTGNTYESPYTGLSVFQEADAGRFFGRSREVAAAVTRLRERPLLGVVGPSGAGKSSFVRAGVLPAIKQSGETWSSIVIRPGRQPMAALAQAVAPMVTRATTPVAGGEPFDHHAVYERLHLEPGYLGAVLRSRAYRREQRILLFVDQFEELYTLVADVRERLAFTACLASAADDAASPLRVVLSIRSDFLDRVAEDAYFMAELAHSLFFLTPPGRDGLREALVEPAARAGYRFEALAMVEHMLDHLAHTSGALPLLQFAASRLWDLRDRERRLLTEDSYRSIGGIAGALASHADAVLAELPPQSQALARSLLLRLVTPERTRAVVPMGELYELSRDPGEVHRLVDHLVQARLLVVQTGGESAALGSAAVELVHESLIHSWPHLRRWLDEGQDDAAFLEQLRNAARQWQARGYANGLLWRGEAMEEARLWYRRYRGELPELQRAYLQAVFDLAERAGRRKRMLIGVAFAFMALLIIAAVVALVLIRNAQEAASEQARVARGAEAQVRLQLETIQAESSARALAEKRILEAQREIEQTNLRLELANAQLLRKAAELGQALERAQKSKRRERRSRETAESNAEAARQAEAEARLAVEELQSKLTRDRERLQELEEQIASMIEDVTIQ